METVIEILKPGVYDTDWGEVELKEEDLRELSESYDEGYLPAPLVLGHPQDTATPAYGWVKGLELGEDGVLRAKVGDLSEEVVDMVKKKKYRRVSASIGKDRERGRYLRHVGLLGARQPAVPGLKDVELASGEDVVEVEMVVGEEKSFTERMEELYRKFQEELTKVIDFVTGKVSLDNIPLDEESAWDWDWNKDADAIIERYGWRGLAAICAYVDRGYKTDKKEDGLPAVKAAYYFPLAKIGGDGRLKLYWRACVAALGRLRTSKLPVEAKRSAYNVIKRCYKRFGKEVPAFAASIEIENNREEEGTMDDKTLAAKEEEIRRLKEELEKAKEKEKEIVELTKKLQVKEVERLVDGLIYEGKVLPGEKEIVMQLLLSLPSDEEIIELTKGDGEKTKYSPRSLLVAYLRSQDKRIEFSEVAKKENAVEDKEMGGYVKTRDGMLVDTKKLEIDKRVRKLMKERGIQVYASALEVLQAEEPDLFTLTK